MGTEQVSDIGNDSIVGPVCFIGLGRMGFPMAKHLVDAGVQVYGFDSNAITRARFAQSTGAKGEVGLREMASRSQVVITMLPTSQIVRSVLVGETNLAAYLAPETVVVDMGTSDPIETQRLSSDLALRSIELIDAPVAGGVVFAEDGTLDILTGGRREIVDRLEPLFNTIGRRTFYCGTIGSAHAMKALNNFVNAAVMSVYMEALIAGKRFGLGERVMRQALEVATLDRNHPYSKKIKTQVFPRAFNSQMALGLIAKDLHISSSLGKSINLEMPIADAVSDLWDRAAEELGHDADQTELIRYWEKRAELELGSDS
ncbi:MAG: NAD(P)-dependent oxidoreductase [Hyphomicrobiaceae bacterium]